MINEIGELRSCNRAMFLDFAGGTTGPVLGLCGSRAGPTLRFFVRRLHTADELNPDGELSAREPCAAELLEGV